MKLFLKTLPFIFILQFIFTYSHGESNHFTEGKKLFENKNYDEAKIKFEKDIVFNPKSEQSYLYLAKIFKKNQDKNLEENNLNTVILLNPKNEEAIYQLTVLHINRSNFSEAKNLIKTFDKVCKKLCVSKKELQKKLNSSLKQ